jgi:FixJ family two-component response regulator
LRTAVRAVAAGSRVLPELSPSIQDLVTTSIDAEDRQIVAMLVDGVASEEVAHRLQISAQWLELRRWAVVRLLVGSPPRLLRRPRGSADSPT